MSENNVTIYCYSDILGYKNILKSLCVDEIKFMLEGSIKTINNFIETIHKDLEKKPQCAHENSWKELKYLFAFDTIIFYIEDIHPDDLYKYDWFFIAIGRILNELFLNGLKLRGVIQISDSKDFYIKEPIFIIKDIDSAFELEKEQEWSGIIINVPKLNQIFSGLIMPQEDSYIFYDVPFKKGIVKKYPCITFTNQFLKNHFGLEYIDKIKKQIKLDIDEYKDDAPIVTKLQETLKFIDENIKRVSADSYPLQKLFDITPSSEVI